MAFMDQDDVLTFLDLLDLDEEVIDQRLKTLMMRNTLSPKHLSNSVHLIQYKLLINSQEDTDCNNDEEFDFVAKLLSQVSVENIDFVCKITNAVLRLNPSSLTSKAEHLLQQILIDLQTLTNLFKAKENNQQDLEEVILLKLKVCDSILDAALHENYRLSIFLETPIEHILDTNNDKLKSHFLMNTVPRLFNIVVPCQYSNVPYGQNILDRIWSYICKLSKDKKHIALKIIVTLSEFYLPTADTDSNVKYESQIIFSNKFWLLILSGMNSSEPALMKIAIYLTKRSIECLINMKRNMSITTNEGLLIFKWDIAKENEFKSMWDSYFVLIESLEEKQSNIVLPSLQLFDTVQSLGQDWLNISYNIGLNHPNIQIKQKCIEYRMKSKLNNVPETKALLEALNDINLYAKTADIDNITLNSEKMFQENPDSVVHVFKAFSLVNWSPVPLYYISKIFTKNANDGRHKEALNSIDAVATICDILKISCNNVPIRRKVHTEFIKLLTRICNLATRQQLTRVMSVVQTDFDDEDTETCTQIIAQWVKSNEVKEKADIHKCISEKYYHLEVVLATMNEDKTQTIHDVLKKLHDINEVLNRQYCDKLEYFNTIAYLIFLYNDKTEGSELKCVKELIQVHLHTLTRYIFELLLHEKIPSEDEITFLANNLYPVIEKASKDKDLKQVIQQINKTSLKILSDPNCELARKIFSVTVLKVSLYVYQDETFHLRDLINATKSTDTKDKETDNSTHSRLLNKFYQTICELVHLLISKKLGVITNIENEIIAFIDNAIECGGYGCLQWVLKLMKEILPTIKSKVENYDIRKFIDRMWQEIEELKSNHQYIICIEDFINILFEVLLNTAKRDNVIYAVIMHYWKKIIEKGEVAVKPLLILARKLSTVPMTSEVGAVYILYEILLFSPVPRKDQRITNIAVLDIISTLPNWESHIHDLESPQHIAVNTLLNITDTEILKSVFESMMNKVNLLFKNKQRYYGNSQHHRVLLAFLQHTLLILLVRPEMISLYNIKWCVDMLRKIPHQPSVKACLEWILALYLCLTKLDLNEANMAKLELRSIPQLSQFMIPFLVLKHRIKYGAYKMEEYTFVMEYLLSYTMGQQYNIRLHAQYLASQLHLNKTNSYDYIMKLIYRNFKESESEKNYIKLKEDFLVNRLDIVHCLTPNHIYNIVPTEFGDENSNMPIFSLPKVSKCIAYIKENQIENEVTKVWFCVPKHDYELSEPIKIWNKQVKDRGDGEHAELIGTIQKKYMPWRNMTDIDGFGVKKKTENTSGLIVVASLIDKLPNLGGLARTSEIFGVQTYVIDSLRHVQDRQFQGLSLSAERWVDIEEVRPGKPLKEYLLRKKTEGYSIVAAEQTSNSVLLQSFKFPKKTLLLLGHEKEGIPSDLLLLTDHFVEIPQQGFIRSLNVHVTAALFVWEYTRQHTLKN